MIEEYPNFLKFIDNALEIAKKIPKYFSKYSNKIYCNHQKLAIIVLMQKLKLTSRGIVSWLRCNSEARLHLGLHRVPVHTTILRFARKVGFVVERVLDIRQASSVAVDGTGFELESKSYYYRNVYDSDQKKRNKEYLKLSVAADTESQVVLSYKIRKKFRNDTIDFKNLLKELKVDYVVADKGYDSKGNREFVLYKLKAIPFIPYRKISKVYTFRGGSKLKFDKKKYNQRSKIETIFSAIKRKYGSVIRSKSFSTQKVELISKLIAYNIDRMSIFLLRVAPELQINNFKYLL